MQRLPEQQPPLGPAAGHDVVSQHGCAPAPQAVKPPSRHTVPASEPDVPDGEQVPVAELKQEPEAQTFPAHGVWYGPPQLAHVAPLQAVNAAVQVFPAQHGWPRPPQPAHVPDAWQTSPAAQADPAAMQVWGVPPRLQQALVQALFAQHGWFTPPQAMHWLARQMLFAEVHVLPAQQTWPVPPHAAQMLLALQAVPAAVHVWPAQQGWPAPPHATQVFAAPPEHTVPVPVQTPPVQHTWPAPPHAWQVLF